MAIGILMCHSFIIEMSEYYLAYLEKISQANDKNSTSRTSSTNIYILRRCSTYEGYKKSINYSVNGALKPIFTIKMYMHIYRGDANHV